jgi:type III secretory pathway component EscV
MNRYLEDYLAGVQAPAVSGFEHLNTLMVRDKLFEQNKTLSPEERAVLLKADHQLIEQAPVFVSALQQITALEYERERREASPERWWWYLDVIIHLPPIQLTASDEYAEPVAA